MQVAAAEFLSGDHLAGGGLHQRRAAKKDAALIPDDHVFVAHRGHVGAAGRARAQHRGDLRDAAFRHRGLVVEDAAEVLAVREHLVLPGQERAARVDEVDTRQVVVQRHLLGAQVLLDRHRVVGAALDGRVVGDDDALAAFDAADPGDDARRRRVAVVHAVGGQRAEFEERRAGVGQGVHPVARQQLAAADVAVAGTVRAAARRRFELVSEFRRERGVGRVVALERFARGVRAGSQRRHRHHDNES